MFFKLYKWFQIAQRITYVKYLNGLLQLFKTLAKT